MNLPSPEAIKIIDSFLKKKKMRLLDLFRLADKDRSGSVTKEEFKGAVKKVSKCFLFFIIFLAIFSNH